MPIMTPWTTELAVAQFAKSIAPHMVIPVHDGYVKDFFLKQRSEHYGKYFSALGITFQAMNNPGDGVTLE
ncbi:MAG: hypothetical protein NVS4B9_42160 [Ktedonobacteraceae bacterium]